jgi:hypothetical protein
MNNMQDFYSSIVSQDKLQETYVKIMADLTKINREQMNTLMSDMGWQDWGEQNQKAVTP